MKESIVFEKAIAFALRIVGLYKYLTEQKREYVISKQILLSGAYIPKHINTGAPRSSETGVLGPHVQGTREKPRYPAMAAATSQRRVH